MVGEEEEISRPFWLCNYACSVAASAKKEGKRGRREGASAVDSSCRDIIADVPSSFFPSGPSLSHSSLISFGHPSNSLFFSLRLPSSRRGLFLSLSLSLPPHSALAANPFPATQSGQASRWKGAINNCIRIYDVLYGRAALGRIRREGRKERRRRRN